MASRMIRTLLRLDLQEKILNTAALLCALAVFFPWLSGEWLRSEEVTYSGFKFYTAFLGIATFILNLIILSFTLVPLAGGPAMVKRKQRDVLRLFLSTLSTILILSALSVLTIVTFDFADMKVRFGIYLCLIASLVTLFESFTHFYSNRHSSEPVEQFHHPDESRQSGEQEVDVTKAPPPPPPPPAPEPEDHPLYQA